MQCRVFTTNFNINEWWMATLDSSFWNKFTLCTELFFFVCCSFATQTRCCNNIYTSFSDLSNVDDWFALPFNIYAKETPPDRLLVETRALLLSFVALYTSLVQKSERKMHQLTTRSRLLACKTLFKYALSSQCTQIAHSPRMPAAACMRAPKAFVFCMRESESRVARQG